MWIRLAQRLRALRKARGLTLDELAQQAGVTKSVISKIENFRVSPSLQSIAGIAKALGVPLAELFKDLEERPALVVVRREERLEVDRDPESPIRYFALAHKRSGKVMEPFLLEVPPRKEPRARKAHEGEEFLMVLEGVIDYEHGEETVRLEAGDCVYDEGAVAHTLSNPGQETARVLCIYAMPLPGGGA